MEDRLGTSFTWHPEGKANEFQAAGTNRFVEMQLQVLSGRNNQDDTKRDSGTRGNVFKLSENLMHKDLLDVLWFSHY